MGVIIRQSIRNTFSTYIGFAIGALNTLFLYTRFLTPEYYGLVGFLLSVAVVLTPLLSFGVHNTLMKFFHVYEDKAQRDRFLTWALILPLFIIVPLGILAWIFQKQILGLLSAEQTIPGQYMWYILLVGGFMAYFDIFYSWLRIHLRSVFGNFMKEVFHRLMITFLLLAVYFKILTVEQFILAVVMVYGLRTLVVWIYALRVYTPTISLQWPTHMRSILRYSSLIIVAGSISIILLDIDKVMIGSYLAIENVAFYNVAVFIAMVIVVPSRAMGQITTPITARLINEEDWASLDSLYKKSSLNLLVVSGWIFLLMLGNLHDIYLFMDPIYATGQYVVILIALVKLSENIIGINTAIITHSKYYPWLVILGLVLAGLTIFLNWLWIPRYGINGAASATFSALLLYHICKIILVYKKFKMHPFTPSSWKALVLIFALSVGSYFVELEFHPLLNISLKVLVITILYFFMVYQMKISEELFLFLKKSR